VASGLLLYRLLATTKPCRSLEKLVDKSIF
jgi:hypothetical protein